MYVVGSSHFYRYTQCISSQAFCCQGPVVTCKKYIYKFFMYKNFTSILLLFYKYQKVFDEYLTTILQVFYEYFTSNLHHVYSN
jgi:hypothetical protein